MMIQGSAITSATDAITAIAITTVTINIDELTGHCRHEQAACSVSSSNTAAVSVRQRQTTDNSGIGCGSGEGVLLGTAARSQRKK